MSDWQTGDLALCVAPEMNARGGAIYKVADVFFDCGTYNTEAGEGLVFFDLDPSDGYDGYDAWRFRKIPPHTRDAEDDETIRLLTGVPEPLTAWRERWNKIEEEL